MCFEGSGGVGLGRGVLGDVEYEVFDESYGGLVGGIVT